MWIFNGLMLSWIWPNEMGTWLLVNGQIDEVTQCMSILLSLAYTRLFGGLVHSQLVRKGISLLTRGQMKDKATRKGISFLTRG